MVGKALIDFDDFLFKYGSCPMCGKALDIDRLRKICNEPSNYEKNMVDFLLDSPVVDGKMKVGIPCCGCFVKLFNANEFMASLFS
jgi:hypothetical protein